MSFDNGLHNTIIDLFFHRITKLEEHKIMQIDENRKSSKKMDELEKKINAIMQEIGFIWRTN